MTGRRSVFDLPGQHRTLQTLHLKTADPTTWNTPREAAEATKQLERLTKETQTWDHLARQCQDLIELALIAWEQKDNPFLQEISEASQELQKEFQNQATGLTTPGPYETGAAIITLQSGAGGTEATLWTKMLLSMYTHWAHLEQRPVELLHAGHASSDGIRTAALEISGPNAYHKLRTETGVHRLVRISPVDPARRRQTSFCQVSVLPAGPQPEHESTIRAKDLRFDTFRSSGPGGQHVQKVDTAVRVTHLPTGTTATCQTHRSQLQNRKNAVKLLNAKLREAKTLEQQRNKRVAQSKSQKPTWGMRARSYCLHPNQYVLDHRTGHRDNNATAVLEGRIENFITAALLDHNRTTG